jgi:hypothetical protein
MCFVLGNAPTPEKSLHLWFSLPAFVVFIQFFFAICCLGSLTRRKLKLNLFSDVEMGLFDLAVGSVGFYFLSYALTVLGLFSSKHANLLWLILSGFVFLGQEGVNIGKWFAIRKQSKFSWLILLLPLIVFLKLLEGLQFHQHGDSYVTYLVGPRAWAVTGNFNSFLSYSQLFLSTSFESLFAWGTALMGLTGGNGLDISQWFSQWVTAGIGVTGTLLGLMSLYARMSNIVPLSAAFAPFVAIYALQVPVLRWTQNLAKNDTGIAFWGVAASFFSLFHAAQSIKMAAFSGLIFGAMVVGKMTTVVLAAALGFFILLKNRKNFFVFVLSGLLGGAPILIRNYALTNNPVFPWLPNVFPSAQLSEFALHGAKAATKNWINIQALPGYISELFQQNPLVLVIPIVFLFKSWRSKVAVILLVHFFAFALFTLFLRPSTEIRYQGPVLIMLSFFAVYFTFAILEQFKQKWLMYFLSLFILFATHITFFSFFQIANAKKFSVFSHWISGTNQIGGPAKLWIRNNLKQSSTILSFGDVHIYYLIDYHLTEIGQSLEYGNKMYHANLNEAELLLRNAPFDYLYLANEDYYKDLSFANDQAKIAAIYKRTESWPSHCKLFDNQNAIIFDLSCLKVKE